MQPQPLFVLYENKRAFTTGFYDAPFVPCIKKAQLKSKGGEGAEAILRKL